MRGPSIAAEADTCSVFSMPATRHLIHGFLEQSWVDVRPIEAASIGALDRFAAYLSWLRRSFVTCDADCTSELREMMMTNAREGLGPQAAHPVDALLTAAGTF